MADERFKAAYEAVLEDAEKARLQYVEKQKVANTMAALYGVEPPFKDTETQAAKATASIKADQFANYGYPSEAARAFLAWRGSEKGATDVDVIFEALSQGGFAFGSTKNDAKGGLRIALGKDGLVRRLPNGHYGLWEWYPDAKRSREKKKSTGSNGDHDNDSSESHVSEDGKEDDLK